MSIKFALILFSLAVASAAPSLDYDPVIRKEPGPRYQYMQRSDGSLHLVDLWLKASNLAEAARFEPDRQNVYHLFTRRNPTFSQPMLMGDHGLIGQTNYDPNRRTIMLLHGWFGDVSATINRVLVPVFLAAENVNVIVVDWRNGASNVNYFTSVVNTFSSGVSVAKFINWLNSVTGATPSHYHLIGHSLGAHQVGIIGRHVDGNIAYITALDAALPGWITNSDKFRPNDGAYTEVIHTNAGLLGYLGTQGQVDFYPNGGINMPGCDSQQCDHERSIHYLAESITSGGFRGTRCLTFPGAMAGQCYLLGRLNMGGLVPKTGSSGIFYLQTNAEPPFSVDKEISKSSESIEEDISKSSESIEEDISKSSESIEEDISKSSESIEEDISKSSESIEEDISKSSESIEEDISKSSESIEEDISKSSESIEEDISKSSESMDEGISKSMESADEE